MPSFFAAALVFAYRVRLQEGMRDGGCPAGGPGAG